IFQVPHRGHGGRRGAVGNAFPARLESPLDGGLALVELVGGHRPGAAVNDQSRLGHGPTLNPLADQFGASGRSEGRVVGDAPLLTTATIVDEHPPADDSPLRPATLAEPPVYARTPLRRPAFTDAFGWFVGGQFPALSSPGCSADSL